MRKWALPSLALIVSVPTAAMAEVSETVFLSCDAARYYKGADEGKVMPEKLYYKVDMANSDVMEFNADLGKYERLCGGQGKDWKFAEPQGNCSVGDDLVSVGSTEITFMATSWKTLFFYRSSGRLSGSERLYAGVVTDIVDAMKKTPMINYDIKGSCQQGVDMSKAKKAF